MRIRRTRAVVAAAAVIASLTLAACAGSEKAPGSVSSGGGRVLELGLQGPLSGIHAQLGRNAEYGLKVAIAQENAKRTLPYTITLKESDDQDSPDVGPTAARALVDDPKVIAVVGPFAGAVQASEPTYSAADLLSVTPSATSPELTSRGFSTFFRLIPSDTAQGIGAADFIVKVLNAKKVYSLHDRSDYGTALSAALDRELQQDGAVVVQDEIDPTPDHEAEADKIIAANPDVLYYSGSYSELAVLAKALKGKGFRGTLMSGDRSDDDRYIEQAGASVAEGTYLTCGCSDPNTDPKASRFVAAVARYNGGATPGTYTGEAYDAASSIVAVLKGLGSNPTRAAVVAAYRDVDVHGLTKTVTYRPDGEIEGTGVYVSQVKDGRRYVIGTSTDLIK